MKFPLPRLLPFCVLILAAPAARAQFSAGSLVATPPNTQAQPVTLNQGQNYPSALSFTINFGQLGVTISRIEIRPGLPPGLDGGGSVQGDAYVVLNRPTVVLFGTPTTPGDYKLSVTATTSTGLVSTSQVSPWEVFIRIAASGTAPTITTQPSNQTVTAGANVTFIAAADGTPTPTFQWRKDGTALSGATSATLALTNVSSASAGNYTVVATNSVGSATSNAATLTVNPLVVTTAPAITAHPLSVSVNAGGTVALSASASGNPAPTYQWRKNGIALTGATSATLVLSSVSAADATSYTVVATNSIGNATSNAATLTLSSNADFGRLSNLSVLTDITASVPSFTLGTVVAVGSDSAARKPLVVRAAGPALGVLGVPGTIADPKVDLLAGQTVVATNDNWNGASDVAAAMASVGAFPYAATTSKDAAIYAPTLTPRDYTVAVSGVGGAIGTVIAEVYDATPAGTFTSATPRLINVSVLKQVNASGFITLGFTIGGSTAKTILIRAIGPGLTQLGVPGVMSDPQLTLFNSASTAIAANDNWGGDAALSSTMTRVNAFAVSDTASKDAMLLITLPPGGYTAQASGVGSSSGLVIVEAYEVP